MKYKHLNLKYILINAFYFMLVCSTIGYANNFLSYKGFDVSIIGIILTVISIVSLIGQTGMAPIVDRSAKLNEKNFILITLAVSIITFIIIMFLPNGSFLIPVFVIIGFAFACMGMPYLNSIAFIYEKEGQTINYGLGRGIGSAAYAVAGQAVGFLISRYDPSIIILFGLVMAIMTFLVVFTLQVPDKSKELEEELAESNGPKKTSYVQFFKKYKQIMIVVLAMICLLACHMLINNYMINIITEIGGDASSQGTAIMIQALVEMPPMFLLTWILRKVKVGKLLMFASIIYSVKHLIILFAPNMTVYYFAMVLQMLSYALIIPGSVYFANEYVAPEDRNQGQAIMAACSTVGGMLASFFGGMLINGIGMHNTLWVGTIVSIVGTLLMIYGVLRLDKSDKKASE